jgi:hypothetical protein
MALDVLFVPGHGLELDRKMGCINRGLRIKLLLVF